MSPVHEVLDHEKASLLLPWLGTDRLEQEELEELLDHLKACRACRRELRDLAELGRFAELAERGEAPDGAAIEARLAGLLGRLPAAPEERAAAAPVSSRPAPLRRPPSGSVGWRQVLPLAALVLLAVGLLAVTGGLPPAAPGPAGPSPAGPYRTLSSAEPAAPAGPALRLVVAESCPEGELRALLVAAGAEIVGGPSRHGVYSVSLAAGADAAALAAAWRPHSCFSYVGPIAGGAPAAEGER